MTIMSSPSYSLNLKDLSFREKNLAPQLARDGRRPAAFDRYSDKNDSTPRLKKNLNLSDLSYLPPRNQRGPDQQLWYSPDKKVSMRWSVMCQDRWGIIRTDPHEVYYSDCLDVSPTNQFNYRESSFFGGDNRMIHLGIMFHNLN